MNFQKIATLVSGWHRDHQRMLPWRTAPAGTRDPYVVWVSEIMAQQTRVETVRTYFERWMQTFPDLCALAAADQQAVLKVWEGLGYYARARNLHRAAQIVVDKHDGNIPDSRKELLALPGVGEYTVGAILSLAFGQAEPVLDGNVKRLLSRLTDEDRPIDNKDVVRQQWSLARSIVEAANAGEAGYVNEGMMELGATVCTPSAPRCLICPLQAECTAFRAGTQAQRPIRSIRPETPHFDVTAGVIWQGQPFRSQLLIAQRAEDGMLGGLWEFPGGKMEETDSNLPACLEREIAEELTIQIVVGAPITVVEHAYTHFRITLHAFHATLQAGEPTAVGCADWKWVDLDDLAHYPFPVTDKQIIEALRRDAGCS